MKAYIYKITNTVNGMSYIGQTTTSVEERWKYHCYEKSTCHALSAAIKKYGKDNFIIDILKEVEGTSKKEVIEILNALEVKLISSYKTRVPNGYNIQTGGKNTWSDKKHKKKGPPRKWTDETREKFIKTKTGMKYKEKTPEEYAKNAERNAKTHFKSIICNETGQTWNSVKECAEFFGVKPKQVSRVLRGQRKHLQWKYSFSYLTKNTQ